MRFYVENPRKISIVAVSEHDIHYARACTYMYNGRVCNFNEKKVSLHAGNLLHLYIIFERARMGKGYEYPFEKKISND